MSARSVFTERGWVIFDEDAQLENWIGAIERPALAAANDPQLGHWYRHKNTWFVGVNALPNDETGVVGTGPRLCCRALALAEDLYGKLPLDAAQVSIAYPGYPQQDPGEAQAAHRFRLKRDAAHIDGMKLIGADRRRKLDEFHAYVLGVPLGDSINAPLVVWDKSHIIMGRAIRNALTSVAPKDWPSIDLTDIYANARTEIFDTCERIELVATRGQVTLLHRFTLHGVAPWARAAQGRPRAIVYFRPAFRAGTADYLTHV